MIRTVNFQQNNSRHNVSDRHNSGVNERGYCLLLRVKRQGTRNKIWSTCAEPVKKNPGNLNAIKNKGYALYFLGRYKESLIEYEKAIDLDPQDLTIHAAKSRALEKLGRYEEAKKCYDEAKTLELDFNIEKFLSSFES